MKKKTQIVVLGGGFAGAWCVRKLERRLRRNNCEITLVNQQNNFVFTPLLLEAATSALEPRHVVVPLRGFLKSSRFLMAEVERIDLDSRQVTLQPEFGDVTQLAYDHLVLALGCTTRLPDVPGLAEFGFKLKSVSDAMMLRDRAIGMLEMANSARDHQQRQSWLTFVVVGAGFTGVEAAGEFNAFLREAIRQYRHVDVSDIRVVLIQDEDRILNMVDPDMSDKAGQILQRSGVEIRVNETVSRIAENEIVLNSGESIAAHTLIWSAGVAPPPILKELHLPKNEHGYLVCDRELRVQGHDNIWGIGDCASNPDENGNAYPPTAQHALREGRQAAKNLAAVLKGRSPQPLNYHTKGTMAPLGGRQAIAELYGIRFSGRLAWFLWRTFYLFIMPGIGRKVRVAMDWTADLFFRRDYSQQGFHRTAKAGYGLDEQNANNKTSSINSNTSVRGERVNIRSTSNPTQQQIYS